MNNENQSLTLRGMTTSHMIHIASTIAMMLVSIYLTKHFFEMSFPEGIGESSAICNITGFWNCDTAVFSSVSSIFNVPIAFFGIILAIIFLVGSIFPTKNFEITNSILARVNAVGCLLLFIYSIIFLGTLCPLCTIFYIFSWTVCYLYIKYGVSIREYDLKASLKIVAWAAIPFLVGSVVLAMNYNSQKERLEKMSANVVEEFFNLPKIGDPVVEKSFRLASATENFADAPLRISIFSDFECPFCARVAKQFSLLAKKYQGKLNLQFIFYPLDKECNYNMERRMHESACKASYLSACTDGKKIAFHEIHDKIFDNQDQINHKWINDLAEKYDLQKCANGEEVKQIIKNHIDVSAKYYIKGTPTIVLNGAKIDAGLPSGQWMALLDGILKHVDNKKK